MAETTSHLASVTAALSQERATVAVRSKAVVVAPHRPSDAQRASAQEGQARTSHNVGGRRARVQPIATVTPAAAASPPAPRQASALITGAAKEALYSFRPLPSPLASATQHSVGVDAALPTPQVMPLKALRAAKLLPNDAYSPCHVTGLLSLTDGSDAPDETVALQHEHQQQQEEVQRAMRTEETEKAMAAPVAAFHALQLHLGGGGAQGGSSSDNLLGGAATTASDGASGSPDASVNDSVSPRVALAALATTPSLAAAPSADAQAAQRRCTASPLCAGGRPADTQLYLLQLLQVVQEIRVEQARSRRELNQVLWQCEQQAQMLHALRRDMETLCPSAGQFLRQPLSPYAAGDRRRARATGGRQGNITAVQKSLCGDGLVSGAEVVPAVKGRRKASASAAPSHDRFVQRLRRRTGSVVQLSATALAQPGDDKTMKRLAEEVHTPRWGRGGGGGNGRVRARGGGRDEGQPQMASRLRHTVLAEQDVNAAAAAAGRRGLKGDAPRRVSMISWVSNTSLPSYDDPGEQSVSTISTASCALEGHDTAVEEMQRQLGALQGNESGLQTSPSPRLPSRGERAAADDTQAQMAALRDAPALGGDNGDKIDSGATTQLSAPSLMSTTHKPPQTGDAVTVVPETVRAVQENKENRASSERLFLTALPPPTRRVSQPLRRQTIVTAAQQKLGEAAATSAAERGNRTTLQPATHGVTGRVLGASEEPPVRRATSGSLRAPATLALRGVASNDNLAVLRTQAR